jgi:hypothetical protein
MPDLIFYSTKGILVIKPENFSKGIRLEDLSNHGQNWDT